MGRETERRREARSVGFLLVYAIYVALSLTVAGAPASAAERDSISLAGKWSFRLDSDDQGVEQGWFKRDLTASLELPGSMQEQGFGHDVSMETDWTGSIKDRSWFEDTRYAQYREPGNIKVPFWLQPEKHYVGAAWYQKDIRIPENWREKRVTLMLERPHWKTTVWLDDRRLGSRDSLSTPHRYELGPAVETGRHRLTIRVDNRMIVDVGHNAHSVSDHTQSNWNGITGDIELRATDPVWLEDVQVYPDASERSTRVRIEVTNAADEKVRGRLSVRVTDREKTIRREETEVTVGPDGKDFEMECDLGNQAQLWDEFDPDLYRMHVELQVTTGSKEFHDQQSLTFGLRDFGVDGTQFTVNGRRTFLRGTLECCIFPRTGYPPTDVDSWKRVIKICQDHGLNHMRFHSWCPPEAAFVAADRLGFYLHVECAAWARIGDGKPIDEWIRAEGDRILREYGNHPSFVMLAYGNEPGGRNRKKYLSDLVEDWKNKDPRRLYTSGAGWPLIEASDFHSTATPRIQQWGEGLRSEINARPPETMNDFSDFVSNHPEKPTVAHETGQWCAYPNFDEIDKYTNVLKARNFEVFRDFLKQNHMGDQWHDFLIASGKLQTICYKQDIESALRTEGLGGFQLLQLHDFPGQGTALVGVLDAFFESKGYVAPDEFRSFCNTTVPLALMEQRTFTKSERMRAEIEVAHFGPGPLKGAVPAWTIIDAAGNAVASGTLSAQDIPIGNGAELGTIDVSLSDFDTPERYTLSVRFEGTQFENRWDFWVYPESVKTSVPEGVMVTERLTDAALKKLQSGGKVLLMPPPPSVDTDVQIGFSSIFWNTAWTGGQPPHTLGLLVDIPHPALDRFVTAYHSDWQWWDLVSHSAAMVLDDMPPGLRPIVQPIDTWFQNRRLGLLFEAQVNGGKLMVCSMDLCSNLDGRPVARQMRHSVLRYMASESFLPDKIVKPRTVRGLLKQVVLPVRGEVVSVDSQAPGHEASKAIDGDDGTMWHTPWENKKPGFPHSITVRLDEPVKVRGFRYLPRQDMSNGRLAKYEIYLSEDGASWGKPVAAGKFGPSSGEKTVRLASPRKARFVRLVGLSEVNGNDFASVAEFDLILTE